MPISPDLPPDQHFERDSTFESLEEIVEAGQRYATQVFADDEQAHRFVLALSEAVSNAIKHGNASDATKRIVVELRADRDQAEALVTDEGGGFDPEDVHAPLDEDTLTQTHGRGLYIIREVADAVHHEAGGRRVRMTFQRAA